MDSLFPDFDPDEKPQKRSLRRIPLRKLLPNLVTLLALCAGLTAIRMGLEGRYELSVGAIVIAAILDALDGRVARLLKSTSRFGAELDSLTDFVNFGVAPPLLLFTWGLGEAGHIGWTAALIYSICCVLRLARFNIALDQTNQPDWHGNYFVGVPAPAGALLVLFPLYLENLGMPRFSGHGFVVALYLALVGRLMVSRLPTWSGKRITQSAPVALVLPLFVVIVLSSSMLVSYPWEFMTLACLAYFATLPLSYRRWQNNTLADQQAAKGKK